ncbi:MAG: hypothetical protein O7G84_19255 [Gammaproteobacteria bacterium]|nr:hypothetical protein [Gammaproteobacteria bacterium]
MAGSVNLEDLIGELIDLGGVFILQNAHGSMEFQGDDLYLSPIEEWITIYHERASSPESQSHLHLRRAMLRSARIARDPDETPHLQFFQTPEPSEDCTLVWYFPSFYDYRNGKADVPKNHKIYHAFVEAHGSEFAIDDAVGR